VSSAFWRESGGQTYIPALFNPGAHLGSVNLSILDERHLLRVEIVSAKLGYEDEYKNLLLDLTEYHSRLIYEAASVSGIPLRGSFEAPPDLATAMFLLRRIMAEDGLPAAFEAILRSPLHALRSDDVLERPGATKGAEPEYIAARVPQMRLRPLGPLAGFFA